jgi:hypothetical protein
MLGVLWSARRCAHLVSTVWPSCFYHAVLLQTAQRLPNCLLLLNGKIARFAHVRARSSTAKRRRAVGPVAALDGARQGCVHRLMAGQLEPVTAAQSCSLRVFVHGARTLVSLTCAIKHRDTNALTTSRPSPLHVALLLLIWVCRPIDFQRRFLVTMRWHR